MNPSGGGFGQLSLLLHHPSPRLTSTPTHSPRMPATQQASLDRTTLGAKKPAVSAGFWYYYMVAHGKSSGQTTRRLPRGAGQKGEDSRRPGPPSLPTQVVADYEVPNG